MKFNLGQCVATRNAVELMEVQGINPLHLLQRHHSGDWGDLSDDDKLANDVAVVDGSRILSAYVLPSGDKLWIITEADRSSTCILKPSDY